MQFTQRVVESLRGCEVYACAAENDGPDRSEPAEMFAAICRSVRNTGSRLCRQRVFVPDGRLDAYRAAHAKIHGINSDHVPTTWLMAGPGDGIGGIQAYAVSESYDWRPILNGNHTIGWMFSREGTTWAVTANVAAGIGPADGPSQTRAAFDAAEAALSQSGMGLANLARTWFFLRDIVPWYGPFNQVRNSLFIDRGILRKGQRPSEVQVPASTGIGVSPADPCRHLALELFGIAGETGWVKRYASLGRQRCAYEYGSAFARVSEARTPAGRTVFVSGTAAIDSEGRTCHAGDPVEQVRMTIYNIMACLRDAGCDGQHVVEAMAYCKTPEVADIFRAQWQDEVRWPWVVVIGDVCRDDLLFEAEVTACAEAN